MKTGIEVPNGWKFSENLISKWPGTKGTNLPWTSWTAWDKCYPSKNLYFAFCGGSCSGTMKTTLRKCGRVRLTFGNCGPPQTGKYSNGLPYNFGLPPGYVEAKLNGRQVGRANIFQSKTIVFDFKDGDMLELTDIGSSVIEFGDLNIISCSTC